MKEKTLKKFYTYKKEIGKTVIFFNFKLFFYKKLFMDLSWISDQSLQIEHEL